MRRPAWWPALKNFFGAVLGFMHRVALRVAKILSQLFFKRFLKLLESGIDPGIDPGTSRFEVESRESLYRTVF